MKTRIDSNLCSGNKKCAIECPEVYEIIEGYGEVKKGMETVPDTSMKAKLSSGIACQSWAGS